MVVILIKWRWPINWISFLWVKFSTVTKLWSLKLVSSVNSFVAWRLLFTWLSLVHTKLLPVYVCRSLIIMGKHCAPTDQLTKQMAGEETHYDRLEYVVPIDQTIDSCSTIWSALVTISLHCWLHYTHTRSIDVIIPSSSLLQGVLWPERLEFHWLLHMCTELKWSRFTSKSYESWTQHLAASEYSHKVYF